MTTKSKMPNSDEANPIEDVMDSWEMATAILVGMRKALAKVELERTQCLLEANQSPFGKGVLAAVALSQTIEEALQSFEAELRKHARSCGLAVPK